METFDCPRCHKTHPMALRFVPSSQWCTPCVNRELFRQEAERDAPVEPQIIEYEPEADD